MNSVKSVCDKLTAAKNLWKSVDNHTSHPWKSVKNFTAAEKSVKSVSDKTDRRQKSAKSVKSVSDKLTAAKNPWKSVLNFTAAAEKKLWKSVENHTSHPWKSVLNSPTPQPTKIHLHIRKNFRNFAHGKHLVTI